MRRLAAATVMLTAVAVGAQAGGLPKAVRLVDRMKVYDQTHYIRGQQGAGGSGSTSYSDEMARQGKQDKSAPQAVTNERVKPAKPGQKQEKPQRAD